MTSRAERKRTHKAQTIAKAKEDSFIPGSSSTADARTPREALA